MIITVTYLIVFFVARQSFCIQYFNKKTFKSIHPPKEYHLTKILFGMSVYYAKDLKVFIVGAPLVKNDIKMFPVGAAFKCDGLNGECYKNFSIINEYEYPVKNNTLHKPLFGMSFSRTSENLIAICSPYINDKDGKKHFCFEYDINSGINAITGYGYCNHDICLEYYFEKYIIEEPILYKNQIQRIILQKSIFQNKYGSYINICARDTLCEKIQPIQNEMISNVLIMNHIFKEKLYVILIYYTTNTLKGSFQVLNTELISSQVVNAEQGTPSQYFGYSGIVGTFNVDDCLDLAISAPFYSNILDEGSVYIYFCDSEQQMYYNTPMLLYGPDEPSARFGISIVNIGKGSDDRIENIAVLAPFWNVKEPRIYIFASGEFRLNQHYEQELILEFEPDGSLLFSLRLMSSFSISGCSRNDILVTYPANDTVKIYSGIDIHKILIRVEKSKILKDSSVEKDCVVIFDDEPCYVTSEYEIKSTVSISFDENINRSPSNILNFEYSIKNSPGAFIKPPKEEQVVRFLNETSSDLKEFKVDVRFIYAYTTKFPVKFEIKAYIDHKPSDLCDGICTDSHPVYEIHEIPSDFSECISLDCQPNVNSLILYTIQTLEQGYQFQFNMRLKIENIGDITSYSLRIDILHPPWLHLKPISETNVDISKFEMQNEIINQHFVRTSYLMNKELKTRDKIDIHFEGEIIVPLDVTLSKIEIFTYDPMYVNPIKKNHLIELSIKEVKHFTFISSSSIPSINVFDYEQGSKEMRNYQQEYFFQLTNTAKTSSIENIVLEINITTSIGSVEVLKHVYTDNSKDFIETVSIVKDESGNTLTRIVFKADQLLPQTIRRLGSIFEIQNSIYSLNVERPKSIELYSKICYTIGLTRICKDGNVSIPLRYPPQHDYFSYILPAVVASSAFLIVFLLLITIIRKTKILTKYKPKEDVLNGEELKVEEA